jgi:hypothetical protein
VRVLAEWVCPAYGLIVVRRVALTVLVLMVLVPTAAFARVAYLCTMDGVVRSSITLPPIRLSSSP